jgi:hypothetical protein
VTVADPRFVLLNIDNWESTIWRIMKIGVSTAVHGVSLDGFLSDQFNDRARECAAMFLDRQGLGLVEFGITDRAHTIAFRLFNGAR